MRNHKGQSKPDRIQGPVQLEHIEAIEKRLWNAADTLRSNSNYASNEYFMPVMGLIFLRHAYSRYLSVKDDIEANMPKRGGKTRALSKEDFSEIYKPFVEELLLRHSLKTVKRHLNNLWLLGGELIRSINMDPEDREKTPMELLRDNIDENGGPSCRHLETDEDFRSYDATCKKLFKFILERKRLKP
jgi:hypothetical protein